MVAGGDLGVQMPTEEVPLIQKQIVQACRESSKPVIVATQMLESMTTNPRPTRAEASDVANAVLDGADCVMLSGETASGAFPLQALTIMDKICKRAETLPIELRLPHHVDATLAAESNAAIARAAVGIAHDLKAAAILSPTESGATALRVSHFRPSVPILAFSPHWHTVNKLGIVWGVDAIHYVSPKDSDALVERVTQLAKSHGYGVDHKPFVVTAGVPLGVQGSTNLVKVVRA
jgi:pyruvate kinase